MTVTEYMTKVTAATVTGEYVGRDMVLGLDLSLIHISEPTRP